MKMRDKIIALEQRVKDLEKTNPDPLLIEDCRNTVRKVQNSLNEVMIRLDKIAGVTPELEANPPSPCCGAPTSICDGYHYCKKCFGPAPL